MEIIHGEKVQQSERAQGQEGNARNEARDAKKWPFREKGQKSKTGDRNWTLGGPSRRKESAKGKIDIRLRSHTWL
jgi:hypothetical protein